MASNTSTAKLAAGKNLFGAMKHDTTSLTNRTIMRQTFYQPTIQYLQLLLFLLLLHGKDVYGGTPAPEQFFREQLVDHVNASSRYRGQLWSQRYYIWDQEFQGPGSPIFVILGGEGNIEPETGLFYPFVTHHLAKIFGAYVLEPESIDFMANPNPSTLQTVPARKIQESISLPPSKPCWMPCI